MPNEYESRWKLAVINCYTRHISNSNVTKEENYTLGFCPKICPTFAHPDSFFFPCIFLEINVKLNAIDDSVGKALRTADLYVYCVCQRSYTLIFLWSYSFSLTRCYIWGERGRVLYVLFKTGLVAICYKGVNKLEQQRPTSLCRRESDLQWNVWMQCLGTIFAWMRGIASCIYF